MNHYNYFQNESTLLDSKHYSIIQLLKKIRLILLLLFFVGIININAQIIEYPHYNACSEGAKSMEIKSIELTETYTIINFTYSRPKGSTFIVPSETYIVPSNGNEKLFLIKATGVSVNKDIKMPKKGKYSYTLYFPRVGKNVNKIDYREVKGNWHIFEINTNPNEVENTITIEEELSKGIVNENGQHYKYINNPSYTALSGEYFRISRIELMDTATILYFEIDGFKGNWVYIPDESCIQPSDGGELLYVKSIEGTVMNKKIEFEDNNLLSYRLIFPKIDQNVKKINFKETNKGGNWFVYELDVSIDPKIDCVTK